MAITMNEKSMHEELDKLVYEQEKDISRTWATLAFPTPKLYTYALHVGKSVTIGSMNIYCYIGLSEHHIKIVTLHALDVTRITATFRIPLADITNIVINNNFLRCTVTLNFGNEKLKMVWINSSAGMDMKTQRKQISLLCEYLSSYPLSSK